MSAITYTTMTNKARLALQNSYARISFLLILTICSGLKTFGQQRHSRSYHRMCKNQKYVSPVVQSSIPVQQSNPLNSNRPSQVFNSLSIVILFDKKLLGYSYTPICVSKWVMPSFAQVVSIHHYQKLQNPLRQFHVTKHRQITAIKLEYYQETLSCFRMHYQVMWKPYVMWETACDF